MWIYLDDIVGEGKHDPRIGDIVIATTTEFGTTSRQVGMVVEAEVGAVHLLYLPVDPDDLEYYG